MQFWYSLVRAVTGKPDVSADDALLEGSEKKIQSLRDQRLSANMQVRLLREIDKHPDQAEAIFRRSRPGFPLTRSLRGNSRCDC